MNVNLDKLADIFYEQIFFVSMIAAHELSLTRKFVLSAAPRCEACKNIVGVVKMSKDIPTNEKHGLLQEIRRKLKII